MHRIGLALGGGGARGLAHIGILKVLEKENIPIYQITGSSIGAIIGGLYASIEKADEVESFIRNLIISPFFEELGIGIFKTMDKKVGEKHFNDYLDNLKMYYALFKAFKKKSVYDEEAYGKIFSTYPDQMIEDLPIKFAAIATDLISGREIIIQEESLRIAVMSSAALPGIFPPVKKGPLLLIDGAMSDSVPVQIVKGQGAHFVMAVDVSKCLEDPGPYDNGLGIIYRTEDITTFHLARTRISDADIIIRPDVRHYLWSDVDKIDDIIYAGEEAAQKALPSIIKMLDY